MDIAFRDEGGSLYRNVLDLVLEAAHHLVKGPNALFSKKALRVVSSIRSASILGILPTGDRETLQNTGPYTAGGAGIPIAPLSASNLSLTLIFDSL